jgi:hypothetical protein
VYKVISEILANRLKLILLELIGQHQSAFVLGHFITGNIIIAYECSYYKEEEMEETVLCS